VPGVRRAASGPSRVPRRTPWLAEMQLSGRGWSTIPAQLHLGGWRGAGRRGCSGAGGTRTGGPAGRPHPAAVRCCATRPEP